jgi:hypothetical protein
MGERGQDSENAASSAGVRGRMAIAPAKHFWAHNEQPTQRAASKTGTSRPSSATA